MASSSGDLSITVESGLSHLSDSSESTESGSDHEFDCVEKAPEPVLSLLDRLKYPKPSELARKRKTNPPKGKRKSSGSSALKCKLKVRPARRVIEFPNEQLTVSLGKLFCLACRETLAVKKSSVLSHVKSSKHQASKEKLKSKKAREESIVLSLKKYDSSGRHESDTLPDAHRVYRIKVLTTFMRAGVPISKLEYFRDILEENAMRLTDRSHMLQLVPFVLEQEKSLLKEEIKGKHLSIIFDGTSRLGEVLAIVVRYVHEWNVHQRLIRLEFLAKSMNGEEIARQLISTLSVTYGIESTFILAAMRDGASVNGLAMGVVKVIYPHIMDVRCFSHTLDLVGDKFQTPLLASFCSYWISLFSHSPKTKMLWKNQTGKSVASYSKTRWWSKWEILHQIMLQFGDIEPFLTANADIGPSLRPKLLDMLHSVPGLCQLKMELAAVVDIGEQFVKATYNLEGDGALMVNCYEEIVKLRSVISSVYYPNIAAVSQSLAPGNPHAQQQYIAYAMSCVQPGINYFKSKFGDDTKPPLSQFKAMRYFSPARIHELQPLASDIDSLSAIPFLNDSSVIAGLKTELPTYLARSNGVNPPDICEWWKNNETLLPNWAGAAKKALLVQPSSAASERVFSLLNNTFGKRQNSSLEDYVESCIMLQYNNR